mmetsp:Transcript_56546/g.132638  ORF Transcript_56546/g.132638 Transcript_56546/m.132638 type:complete len:232 (-) Transcript_56546:7-702(-)
MTCFNLSFSAIKPALSCLNFSSSAAIEGSIETVLVKEAFLAMGASSGNLLALGCFVILEGRTVPPSTSSKNEAINSSAKISSSPGSTASSCSSSSPSLSSSEPLLSSSSSLPAGTFARLCRLDLDVVRFRNLPSNPVPLDATFVLFLAAAAVFSKKDDPLAFIEPANEVTDILVELLVDERGSACREKLSSSSLLPSSCGMLPTSRAGQEGGPQTRSTSCVLLLLAVTSRP